MRAEDDLHFYVSDAGARAATLNIDIMRPAAGYLRRDVCNWHCSEGLRQVA